MGQVLGRFPQYEKAEALENYLGNPAEPARPLSFERALELDEAEQYPLQAFCEIDKWGFRRQYVPREYGGAFRSFEELFSLLRVLARRDITVTMAHVMSYVAATAIWLRANEEQKARLAEILKGGDSVAIALTEKNHGADVLANELTAAKVSGGYALSGEKWLISNATRAAALTLFARTDAAGGPRGFSLFFIEKHLLSSPSFTHLPRIKTHGVRGADIAGFRFDGCFVPDSALVGTPGGALETTLKAFQISRTILPAAALGAGETALRSTVRFALSRRLHRGAVFSIPEAQRVIVDAFVRLLVCECVAVAAARSLHIAASQMSIWSAVTKCFVPEQVDQVIRDLAVVMGARHYLREGHDGGVFQKVMREGAALGAFHLGGYLNLSLIGQQMRSLANYRAKAELRDPAETERSLELIFSLEKQVPEFDPLQLELFNRGRDDVLQGMEICLARLSSLRSEARLNPETAGILVTFAEDIISEIETQERRLSSIEHGYGNAFNQSPELFALARRHCTLHAAASCLWMWLFNRDSLGDFFAQGDWLVEGLSKLMMTVCQPKNRIPPSYGKRIADQVLRLHAENMLFSILSFKLGD